MYNGGVVFFMVNMYAFTMNNMAYGAYMAPQISSVDGKIRPAKYK